MNSIKYTNIMYIDVNKSDTTYGLTGFPAIVFCSRYRQIHHRIRIFLVRITALQLFSLFQLTIFFFFYNFTIYSYNKKKG